MIKFEVQIWVNDLDKITQQVNGRTRNRIQMFFLEHDLIFPPLPYPSPTLPISALFMNVC